MINLFVIIPCIITAAVPTYCMGIPPKHVQILDRILPKYINTSSIYQNSMLDFLMGKKVQTSGDVTIDLGINVLDHKTLKNIIEVTQNRLKNDTYHKYRRLRDGQDPYYPLASYYYSNHKISIAALHMMRQSIYATRYRLQDTKKIRQKYVADEAYHLGFMISTIQEIYFKSEHLWGKLTTAFDAGYTYFFWFLMVYEKLLTANIDMTQLVQRAFLYHEKVTNKTLEIIEDSVKGSFG